MYHGAQAVSAIGALGTIGASGSSTVALTGENKDIVSFAVGNPLARHPSGTGFILAAATSIGLQAIGLSTTATAVGFSATIQIDQWLTLADWTPIIGSVSLSALTSYYLSPTTGLLTATAPTTVGQIAQLIGVAVGPQTLELTIGPTILL